jgi:zinc transport system substrate-binding protein
MAIALAMGAATCASVPPGGGSDALQVVVGAYPLEEAARAVGGNRVQVTNLTPPGVEPHDLELAPDDVEAIVTADVVVLVGGGFQTALEDVVGQASGVVVDVLDDVRTLAPPEDDHADEAEHEEGELAADPHVWLDPIRYAQVVDSIAGAFVEASPEDAAGFRERAGRFVQELEALDDEFATGLRSCESRTIVVNHAAFGYMADAYDLEQHAISGLSPEAEPDPARLAELTDLVRAEGVTTVFTEELASPEVAETLAREAGVAVAVLDPLEGLSVERQDAGEDYGSIMRRNLSVLRSALGCS